MGPHSMGKNLQNLSPNIGPSCYSKRDIVKFLFSTYFPIWHYWRFSHFFDIFHRQFVNLFENFMQKIIVHLKFPIESESKLCFWIAVRWSPQKLYFCQKTAKTSNFTWNRCTQIHSITTLYFTFNLTNHKADLRFWSYSKF